MVVPIALAGTLLKTGIASKLGSIGIQKAKNASIELYGYDFVGLLTKLVIYFIVAYFIEKYIYFTQQKPINSFLSGIFGAIGGLPLFAISATVLKYFDSSQVNSGIKFWDIVKGGAIALVIWEMWNFYNGQKILGGKASPMTLGLFGLIISLLAFITIPDVLKKVQEKNILFNLGV